MSSEWLDIQNFVNDQEALRAINDLTIATHLSMAHVVDEDRVKKADQAKQYLKRFLFDLNTVLQARRDGDVAPGVDPRMQELAESFELARRDSSHDHSIFLKTGPTDAILLLEAQEPPARRELLRSLDELRELITSHQQTHQSAILEDF